MSIKEEVIQALQEERKLKCPFCGHDKFFRTAKEEPILVEMIDDGDSVRDEDLESCVTSYLYSCASCRRDVTDKEMK